jgi:molybdate transport system permease protein
VAAHHPSTHHVRSDVPFYIGLGILSGSYVLLIVAMLAAELSFTHPNYLSDALTSERIQYSIALSLLSCSLTTILALWAAVPFGYSLARFRFPGKQVVETLVDVPIVLPPLVVGLALLILFRFGPLVKLQQVFPITFAIPSVVLAQFAVATAFAIRTMRVTFDQLDPRPEEVALTLGCTRSQAFWLVALPQARRGMVAAGTLAWARSLGEFGPILIFSGATEFRTEVLPTSVWLEFNTGSLGMAVAVSILLIVVAAVVLVIARMFGLRDDRGGA